MQKVCASFLASVLPLLLPLLLITQTPLEAWISYD